MLYIADKFIKKQTGQEDQRILPAQPAEEVCQDGGLMLIKRIEKNKCGQSF
jgi:hypothetical protein